MSTVGFFPALLNLWVKLQGELASIFLWGNKIRPSKNKADAIPSAHQTLVLKQNFLSPPPCLFRRMRKWYISCYFESQLILGRYVNRCSSLLLLFQDRMLRFGTNWPIKHMYDLLFTEWHRHSMLRTLAASQGGVKLNTCIWLQIIKRNVFFYNYRLVRNRDICILIRTSANCGPAIACLMKIMYFFQFLCSSLKQLHPYL